MVVPLLMGNSPAPMVRPHEYDNFSCSFVSKTKETDQEDKEVYVYTFEVVNSGDAYIDNITVKYPSLDFASYMHGEDSLFGETIIAPGKTDNLYLRSYKEYDFSTSEGTFTCNAYQDFVKDAIKIENSVIRADDSNTYYVKIDPQVKLNFSDYEYGVITEISYKGETYISHHQLSSNNEFFLTRNDTPLDVDQITFVNMIMTKDKAYKSALGTVLLVVGIIIGVGMIALVGGVIFLIVFFSVRAVRKKKKLKGS